MSAALQSYSVKEIRGKYGVGKSAWRSWMSRLRSDKKTKKEMENLGFVPGMKLYTPAQVSFLFNKLGTP